LNKGVDTLLSSISFLLESPAVVPFHVDIYGSFKSAADERRLRAMADSLGVQGYITFHGRVYGSEKQEAFEQADIFVLPSEREGFPNALLEAMLMSLPAVVSDVGAMPEIVVTGQSGLVFPAGDSAALARCLRELLGDLDHRTRMGAEARKSVLQRYDLNCILAEFKKLYISVAKGTD
jgi:glycosyltransferase involved in cell wall biosynthesis